MKDYLGDGVYAIYDGFGIWLHANDHENPTDRIYLEPSVLEALIRFQKRAEELKLKERKSDESNKVPQEG